MTMKTIEMAYEEIYDFLDEIDSHPLSAQISLPIPDLIDGVWVDKYFVYEDVSIGGKHIAYSPDWIFIFKNGEMLNGQHIENDDIGVIYRLSVNDFNVQKGISQYVEVYEKLKCLRGFSNGTDVIDQYVKSLKRIVPKELLVHYVAASTQLAQWMKY